MKMKVLILTCMCVGLWSCGTPTKPPEPEQPASTSVQETKPAANEEEKKEESSMENLEEDC